MGSCILAHRYSMVHLCVSLDVNTYAHDGPEARRVKLAFMEEKVYNNSDGFVAEPIFNQWLPEFDSSRRRAVMNTPTKHAWKGAVAHFQGRERRNQGGPGGSNLTTPPN
ncbi:hypothetical protein CYMTET_3346 [Cymbomonas tetramitiformis]|uniref:Uncharacterized protein n=1 Tax=Cymbomonas tetramitiformis TaxID=36881 RepID=A0AAE0H3H8_9CHLO|nr:hypothetical protein CYMTET_3346 [Cymbomonas tetramitiformis]